MTNLNLEMKKRFEDRKLVRKSVAVIFIVSSVIYLYWRLKILNFDAPFISIVFFAAEIIGFVIALGAIFLSSSYSSRESQPAPQNLDVDVFVTVYNEPYDVIRRTITAAVKIRYPHRTVVLDDGNNPLVKELSINLGCSYLARGKNTNAKAGNLNFGFGNSTAEFVMVFDADHIPQNDALDKMLGYFSNPNIALVQSPQDFYNLDSIQFENTKDGYIWHDQSFFYHLALPNADTFGGPICVGTGVIYRRSAINEIGGIPTDTITEDLHTSLKLHKKGFETAYHHESIAYGIGEIGLEDYYTVRQRWGHGNIHALRIENILFCKNLNFKQRLNYLLVGLNYLEGWQYLIFYLVPIYSLLTGIAPFEITPLNISIMIFFPIFTYLLVQEFTCGFGRFWLNELYAMMRFPIGILSTFAVFRDKLIWKSSSKEPNGKVAYRLMAPQLAIVIFSLGALIYSIVVNWGEINPGVYTQLAKAPEAILKIDFDKKYDDGFSIDLLIVAGFWALFNVARGIVFVWKVVRSARNSRKAYMFEIPLLATIVSENGVKESLNISAISTSEIRIENGAGINISAEKNITTLHLPSKSIEILIIEDNTCDNNIYDFELKNRQDLLVLEDILFSVRWHRRLFFKHAKFSTPLGVIQGLFSKTLKQPRAVNWRPLLTQGSDGNSLLVYNEGNNNSNFNPIESLKDEA